MKTAIRLVARPRDTRSKRNLDHQGSGGRRPKGRSLYICKQLDVPVNESATHVAQKSNWGAMNKSERVGGMGRTLKMNPGPGIGVKNRHSEAAAKMVQNHRKDQGR